MIGCFKDGPSWQRLGRLRYELRWLSDSKLG